MSATLSRSVMTMAACCLGEHRRDWALAMEAEFAAAVEEGEPLVFAIGCLVAAARDMPMHREGRFALAIHLFVLGVMLPIAALLVAGALLGFPYMAVGHAGALSILWDTGKPALLLNDGSRAAAPALTLSVLLLAAVHLVVAWLLLERDWVRAAALARFSAATTATLILFTAVLLLDQTRMLLPVASLAIQSGAVLALARWHEHLSADTATPGPGG